MTFLFEGCEGTGKTTLIRKVSQNLKRSSKKPGNIEVVVPTRPWLLFSHDQLGYLLLASMLKSYKNYTKPPNKKLLLYDRSWISILTYQGILENENRVDSALFSLVESVLKSGDLPPANQKNLIYLDAPAELALKRRKHRDCVPRDFTIERFNRVKKAYETVFEIFELQPLRFTISEDNEQLDLLHTDVTNYITKSDYYTEFEHKIEHL